jgi:myo-inositol 2-dehydrogenase/D-chiro-inositol 1-dehydrogenase
MHFFLERYEQAYKFELNSFIAALSGADVTLPTMHDGLQAMRLAEAALLSVAQNRSVDLDQIEG